MNTDIKCPYCGTPVLKNVSYSITSGYFHAKHKCRRCKMVFPITIMPKVLKTIDTRQPKVIK